LLSQNIQWIDFIIFPTTKLSYKFSVADSNIFSILYSGSTSISHGRQNFNNQETALFYTSRRKKSSKQQQYFYSQCIISCACFFLFLDFLSYSHVFFHMLCRVGYALPLYFMLNLITINLHKITNNKLNVFKLISYECISSYTESLLIQGTENSVLTKEQFA
jgi:hypothetical protein